MSAPLLALGPERLRALLDGGVLSKVSRELLELAEKRASEPKASGALRAPAAAAWHMGGFPKPKTTPPSHEGQPAHGMPPAKPPSNRAFHEDVVKSMVDPARGARVSLSAS